MLQPNPESSGLTFDDDEGGALYDAAISVGDLDDAEEDDFELAFPGTAPLGVEMQIIDNTPETGELLSAKPFVQVTWADGVDPASGRPLEIPGARVMAFPGTS